MCIYLPSCCGWSSLHQAHHRGQADNMKQWFMTWFHRFGSPKWFYQVTEGWSRVLAALSCLLLLTGVVWGLVYSPADYLQGDSYRIIFLHVPSAFLAQSIYLVMAVAAFIYCVWRMTLADYVIQASVVIGMLMTALALISGAIWGKPTWGTWWQWDARITTMFILLLLYFGIMLIRHSTSNQRNAAYASALVTLLGIINIPLIKYSVDWWFTLHQPATLKLTEKPTMATSMLIPLLITIAGFYMYYAWILLIRLRSLILLHASQSNWIKKHL